MNFFVTGDEWGLAEVVPAENEQFYREVGRQAAEHHKDTQFGPTGWSTPPFLIPPPRVPLSERAIRLTELEELFEGVLARAARVETCEDFTGPPFEAKNCFAFAGRSEDVSNSPYRAGFYGDLKDETVTALYWSERAFQSAEATRVADVLAVLGARHRLILVWQGSRIIHLEDREQMATVLYRSGDGSPG